jgi:putative membrane protein
MHQTIVIIASYLLATLLLFISQEGWVEQGTPFYSFLSVISYSLIGTATLFVAYKLIDWIIPADIEGEIFERKNLAAAVFKGLLLVGIALIISAVIISP